MYLLINQTIQIQTGSFHRRYSAKVWTRFAPTHYLSQGAKLTRLGKFLHMYILGKCLL
jgi:hypothetical protein